MCETDAVAIGGGQVGTTIVNNMTSAHIDQIAVKAHPLASI